MNRQSKRQMGRAEKRRTKREVDKLSTTINKLDHNQIKLIENLASIKANNMTKERVEELELMVDRAVTALLIQVLPDKTYEEIEKIEELYGELILEDAEKIRKLKDEVKGDSEMAKKMMEKYEEEVRVKAQDLASKDITQKEAIEELVMAFPKLSKAMLTNGYKKVKAELKKQEAKEDKELEEVMGYIFSEEGQAVAENATTEEEPNVAKDTPIEEKPAVKENLKTEHNAYVSKTIENNSREKEEEVKVENKLKVLSMTVQGDNGKYKVCKKGVELQSEGITMFFEDIEQLETFTEEYKQVFKMVK